MLLLHLYLCKIVIDDKYYKLDGGNCMSLLQKRIMEASQKYYTDGSSDISDKEFDEMLDQLREEDPNSELLGVGHGYVVDKDTTPGEKVTHKYGLVGSLDKCHNWKEFPPSLKNKSLWGSLKLDGLSVVLEYDHGKLIRACTRGDGKTGVDITPKAIRILRTDEIQDKTFSGAVRGEIIMSYSNFEMFQAIHPEAKNPRNSAVGLINAIGSSDDLDFLNIVVYTVVGLSDNWEPKTYRDMRVWLQQNFTFCACAASISTNEDTFISDMEHLQKEWYGYWPADGIVITDNELQLNPYYDKQIVSVIYQASAFKFKAESATTKVIGVEWNLSKTKYLIPRIQFETVQLSGTSVSYCTGHNAQYIIENGIDEGAVIEVLKSGEIIPYLEKVHKSVAPNNVPSVCPCCSTPLVRTGVHLQCPNTECADSDVQDTLVWMQNIAPYDGLGDILKLKFLSLLLENDISIEKIYQTGPVSIDETRYVKLNEFYKMYNMLFTNEVKLADAIKALNIPRFGDVTSTKLAEHPEVVKELIRCACNDSPDVPDYSDLIGYANFKSLIDHIGKLKRLKFIENNIKFEYAIVEQKGQVAITGKLSVKRAVFEQELRDAGYISGSISKNTKFLITDDPNSSSDKNKKADKFGIQKITESEFRRLYM